MESSNKAQVALKPIKGNITFQDIFRKSKKLIVPDAFCYVVFDYYKRRNADSGIRPITLNYAVVVKKKNIRKAVCRNRAKRLLREAIRINASQIDNQEFLASIKYIVFYWAKPMDTPGLLRLPTVTLAVSELLAKAESFYNYRTKEYAIEKNTD